MKERALAWGLGGAVLVVAWFSYRPGERIPSPGREAVPAAAGDFPGYPGGPDPARREVSRAAETWSPWSAGVGTRLTYAYSIRQLHAAPLSDGGTQRRRSTERGELQIEILDRDDESILVAASFSKFDVPEVRAQLRDAKAEEGFRARIEAASSRTLLRMDHEGLVRGYRFDDALDADGRNFVRTLLGPTQIVVPGDHPRTWCCEQADASGRFLVEYAVESSDAEQLTISRRRLRYTELGSGGALPRHEVEDASSATFSRALGWFESIRVDERFSIDLPGIGELRHERVGTVELRRVARAPLEAGSALIRLDPDRIAPVAGHIDVDVERARRATLLGRAGDRDLSEILAELEQVLAKGAMHSTRAYELFEQLTAVLTGHPEQMSALGTRVSRGELDPALAGFVLSAVAATQAGEASDILLAVLGSATLDDQVREAAVIASHQLRSPSEPIVRSLADLVEGAVAMGALEASGLLALGTLEARSASDAADALADLELRAIELDGIEVWLQAVGNSGDPGLLTRLVPYLAHEREDFRALAVDALRRMPEEVRMPHAIHALQDASASVRVHAVEILPGIRSPEATTQLRRIALMDPEEHVRRAALRAIGSRLDVDPEGLRTLRSVRESDPSRRLRAFAEALIRRHQ